LGKINTYHVPASGKIFSLIGNAFYKSDGITLGNWDYDIDLTYIGTSGSVSSYILKNQQLLINGEFKIRQDHQWSVSWWPDEMPILGDPGNFVYGDTGPNYKALSEKVYNMTFLVNWETNNHTLLLNDGSQFVVTTSIGSITTNSATASSEIFNEGLSPVTERGVCWNNTPNPTPANNSTYDGPEIGKFTSYLTGLSPNTTFYIRAYAINSEGITYGNEVSITTVPECQSDFVYSFDAMAGTLGFTSLSTNASDYYWDFGDGNFSTVADPEYAYVKAGVYRVCLTIWNSSTGCQSVSCQDVVYAPVGEKYLQADFSFLTSAANLTVSFSDLSSTNATEWYWTMGDGRVMKTQNPLYTYAKPGIYTVCLTAIDNVNLLIQTVCKEIKVGEIACSIRSDFSYFINPAALEVSFSNNVSGTVTDYFWTFGDGRSSVIDNPTHSYSAPGYYRVGLSVRDNSNNCLDMFEQYIQVGSVDCRAGFSFGVDPDNNTVNFRDDSKGQIDYYYWDFGDGTFSVLQNPDKFYKKAGIYLAGLTVIDNTNGCIDFYVQPVQVGEVDCSADFDSYIDPSANTGYFTNKNVGEATAVLWSFGDGRFSTEENPVHQFSNEGIYSVGLNTYDFNSGCMDYSEETILVGELGIDCEADFIYILDPSNPEVTFKNKSIGDIAGSVWNFGDGSENSEAMDPVHTFTKGGYYLVCLNVITPSGIRNMTCKWVLVDGSPATDCRANFMYSVDSINRSVTFVDNSFGDINKYTWDFGDGKADSVSSLKDPGHIYNEKGYYLVQLKVENTLSGCVSSEYKLLNVAEAQVLKAAFGYEAKVPDKKLSGYPVDLVSASSGDGATVEWDFGDKNIKKASFTVMDSTSGKVTHYYQLPGKYLACLRVSDPVSGQSDEYCSYVYTKFGVKVEEIGESGMTLSLYPNPFVDYTTINYSLPEPQFVEISIFDQLGRKIETLVKTGKDSGTHQMIWETKSRATGVYHLKLITSEMVITKQLVITR
jgi:PKD repeat protein